QTYRTAGYARARQQYYEFAAQGGMEAHQASYFVAGSYALAGDKQRALDYLERAYQEHSNQVTHLKVDSYFDSVHDEPRFQQLLKKLRLDDESLAAAAMK